MAERLDVFPPSNLSGDSKVWSRNIEDRIRNLSYIADTLSLAINGDNRAMAGQMGAVGRQIEELSGRSTNIIGAAGFTTIATTANVWASSSLNVPIPPSPAGRRAALVNVSSSIDDAPGLVQYTAFVTVFYNGEAVARQALTPPSGTTPAGYKSSFSLSFPATVDQTGGVVRIQMEVLNFQTANGPAVVAVEAPVVTAMYGDLLT